MFSKAAVRLGSEVIPLLQRSRMGAVNRPVCLPIGAFPSREKVASSYKSCFDTYERWIVLAAIYAVQSEKQETFWLWRTYSAFTMLVGRGISCTFRSCCRTHRDGESFSGLFSHNSVCEITAMFFPSEPTQFGFFFFIFSSQRDAGVNPRLSDPSSSSLDFPSWELWRFYTTTRRNNQNELESVADGAMPGWTDVTLINHCICMSTLWPLHLGPHLDPSNVTPVYTDGPPPGKNDFLESQQHVSLQQSWWKMSDGEFF